MKKTRQKKSYTLPIVLICVLIAGLIAGMVIIGLPVYERATYKLGYIDEINSNAGKYGLAPQLVAAVMHCESGMRADAVSSAGAVGLMQIMPDTGEWIAPKIGITDYTDDMLTDPKVNIEMGCWYLAYLNTLFSDQGAVIAAYNAGQGTVSGWLADSQYTEDGVSLSSIPYGETEQYVERVEAALKKYTALYPEVFA